MGPLRQLVIVAICIGFRAVCCAKTTEGGDGKTIVCYWQSWSHKRPAPNAYNIDDIPVHLCTHVIYSYARLNNDATSLYLDESFDLGRDGYWQFTQLKRRNPSVKLLLALGDRYGSDLAAWTKNLENPARRFQVLKLVTKLVKEYNFDGVHFNWEWLPEANGVRAAGPTDASLHKFTWQIKRTMNVHKPFIVSCVMSLPLLTRNASQDAWIKQVERYVDFFHLSTRSLSLGGDINPAISDDANANATVLLQSSSNDDLANGVHYLGQLGVPKRKLLYEIQFSGMNCPPISGVTTTVSSVTIGRKEDLVPYYEICAIIKNGVSPHWDETQDSPYITIEPGRRLFYDDAENVRRKVTHARSMGLGGVVAWSVDMDNINADYRRKNDLLKGIVEGSNALTDTAATTPAYESASRSLYEENENSTEDGPKDERNATSIHISPPGAKAGTTEYPAFSTKAFPPYDQSMTTHTFSTVDDSLTIAPLTSRNESSEERDTTQTSVSEDEATNKAPSYVHADTTEAQELQRTTNLLNTSRPDGAVTRGEFRTRNDTAEESSATYQYDQTSEASVGTDDFFEARTTEAPEHGNNMTQFSTSHDNGVTTGDFRSWNDTTNRWGATAQYEPSYEASTTRGEYLPARTAEAREHEENTTLISSPHNDGFTTEDFHKGNYTNNEWNSTSQYEPTHGASDNTTDYFPPGTTEAPEYEENTTTFLTSPHYNGFTTEDFQTGNDTNNEWNSTSQYEPTHRASDSTDDYLPAGTTEAPEYEENTTTFRTAPHYDGFTTEDFHKENYTNNEWTSTSQYEPTHGASEITDDYFPAGTTEAPEYEENTTFRTSPPYDGFTTEDFQTENDTNNEWSSASQYEPTHGASDSTDDYLSAGTTEAPEYEENTTTFRASPPYDGFTTEDFQTGNDTNNEWISTSLYEPTHGASDNTDGYFPAGTTEAPENEENTTTFRTSPHYNGFTTEDFQTGNDTNNEWNMTSLYEPTHQASDSTDYFPAGRTEAPQYEENTTSFRTAPHYNGSATEDFQSGNDTNNERNSTSQYESTHGSSESTYDYFPAGTTEAPEYEENTTMFRTSPPYDGFTTEDFQTGNDTNNEWNSTSQYEPTHGASDSTDDYLSAGTTEAPEYEENKTTFRTSPPYDGFTTEDFQTGNDTNNEWNSTSLYEPTHGASDNTDDYFPAGTTEAPENEENTTTFRTSPHYNGFTTEDFQAENDTNNEWNMTSLYEPTHQASDSTDYFPAGTTEAPQYEENTTAFRSAPHYDGFTTEYFQTGNNTNNEWNSTSQYEPTHGASNNTDDYFPAGTTEAPEDDGNTTTFMTSPHYDGFTTKNFETGNDINNEWNMTSLYEPTQQASDNTDYFPAGTEAPQHGENMTAINYSHVDGVTRESFITGDDATNAWDVTSKSEPRFEAFTSTDDYFTTRSNGASGHEENLTTFNTTQDEFLTTGDFRTGNGSDSEWDTTSEYEQFSEASTSIEGYSTARTTEARNYEEVSAALNVSTTDSGYTSGESRTGNDRTEAWDTASTFEVTHEGDTGTRKYMPVETTKAPVYEHTSTTLRIFSTDDSFTSGELRTTNVPTEKWPMTKTPDYGTTRQSVSRTDEETLATAPVAPNVGNFASTGFMTEVSVSNENAATPGYITTTELPLNSLTGDENGETAAGTATRGKTVDSMASTTPVASTTSPALESGPQTADRKCKNATSTNVPHESDGEFYYRCYKGMALLRKCSQGQRFNISLGQCSTVPSDTGNTSAVQTSSLSHILMKFFGNLASGKTRLGKDEKLDVNVNYRFSLSGRR